MNLCPNLIQTFYLISLPIFLHLLYLFGILVFTTLNFYQIVVK